MSLRTFLLAVLRDERPAPPPIQPHQGATRTNNPFGAYIQGDEVMYCGVRARVNFMDSPAIWDNENLIPIITVSYVDKMGAVHNDDLCPAEAHTRVQPVGAAS